MKKFISFLMALSLTLAFFADIPISISAAGDIAINETNFPDEIFRNHISTNIDKNSDGYLSTDEILDTNSLVLDNTRLTDEYAICNLKGIEFFTELTYLSCRYNKLTSLDLSQNTKLTEITCLNNQLTALNISNCTALTYLACDGNNLTTLNLSNNTLLTELSCASNKLTALDVNSNTKLTSITFSFNEITGLDLSRNTALERFSGINNQLSELDVSQNTSLTVFNCYNNQLTSLDVSKNVKLETFMCQNNQLTSLDVSANTALKSFNCNNNQITSLNVSNNTALTAAIQPLCNNNTYTVSTCVLDPADLPGEFDISKASNWTNAEVADNKIFSLSEGNVTYSYDCGNGKTRTFTLVFPSRNFVTV